MAEARRVRSRWDEPFINRDVREAMRLVLTGEQFDAVVDELARIRDARTEVRCNCCGFINTDKSRVLCAGPNCGCNISGLWVAQ